MVLKPVARLVVLATALVTAAVPLTETASASTGTPVYRQSDSGRTAHVALGDKFKVRLKVCEDCGYRWSFAHRPDKSIAKLVRKTDVSSAKPPAVGGINTVTWTYKGVGTGKTRLKLVERSPSQEVTKRFTLTVSVHPRLVVD
jgi:predicted secreted protein